MTSRLRILLIVALTLFAPVPSIGDASTSVQQIRHVPFESSLSGGATTLAPFTLAVPSDNLSHLWIGTLTGNVQISGGSLTSGSIIGALGYTPENAATSHVNSFNTRTGAVVLSSPDVTTAIGYTPQASGAYITALTGDVTASGPGSATATLSSVVTPGTVAYPASVTFDAKGRATAYTAGSAPVTYTPGTGIGITGGAISNSGVLSYNSRTGAVTPQSSDLSGLNPVFGYGAAGGVAAASGTGWTVAPPSTSGKGTEVKLPAGYSASSYAVAVSSSTGTGDRAYIDGAGNPYFASGGVYGAVLGSFYTLYCTGNVAAGNSFYFYNSNLLMFSTAAVGDGGNAYTFADSGGSTLRQVKASSLLIRATATGATLASISTTGVVTGASFVAGSTAGYTGTIPLNATGLKAVGGLITGYYTGGTTASPTAPYVGN